MNLAESPRLTNDRLTRISCKAGWTRTFYNAAAMKKHILSVSYDDALLSTRHWILEQAGYKVSSAFGFSAALEICTTHHGFDLILMGHSIPQRDKKAILAAIRPQCKAPLLSIFKHGESPIAEASYVVDAQDGPSALLEVVKEALK